MNLSLWLTNPSLTQDDQIKKGTKGDSGQDNWLAEDQEKEKKVKPHSAQENSNKATTDCQQGEGSKPQSSISNFKILTDVQTQLMLYSTTPTDQQCIFIRWSQLSPYAYHQATSLLSIQLNQNKLTQEIILKINSTKKEKRPKEEGPKYMRREIGMK